jgi:acyl carrier protein
MNRNDIVSLVCQSVSEVLDAKGEDSKSVVEDTVIFGSNSTIDSLDLVNVIVVVEEAIADKTGKQITIVDEASLISGNSPFRTVGSLSQLIQERLSG